MTKTFDTLAQIVGPGRIRQNESLITHTILKYDCIAEWYIETQTLDDFIKIVQNARQLTIPVFVLGGGSNFPVSDGEINGLVIKNNCHRFDKMSVRGTIRENQMGVKDALVYAESGTIMNQLVRYTIEEGLEGLEYQLGLPGTVGGAIYTNAKYKNKQVRDFLYSLRILDESGNIENYSKELPYFVNLEEELTESKDIILAAVFKLMPENKDILWARGNEAAAYRNSKKEVQENKISI